MQQLKKTKEPKKGSTHKDWVDSILENYPTEADYVWRGYALGLATAVTIVVVYMLVLAVIAWLPWLQ